MQQKDEFRLFIKAINYGISKKDNGEWTQLDYDKHMLQIYIKCQLPIDQIIELEQRIKIQEVKSEEQIETTARVHLN